MPKCRICKAVYKPIYNSTEVTCGEYSCRLSYALKWRETEKKRKQKEVDKKVKAIKEKVKDWERIIRPKINRIARIIDKDLPCLATGRKGQIHGGHIFSRGAHSNMRFNLHNIHRQSAQSNHWQNDDFKLREGLKREYGIKYYEFLESMKGCPPLKFTTEEYKELNKSVNEVLKWVQSQEAKDASERMALRNICNMKLNIYYYHFQTYSPF